MTDRPALPFEISADESEVTLGNRTMLYRSDVAGDGWDEDGLRFWNLIVDAVGRSASPVSAASAVTEQGEALRTERLVTLPAALLDDLRQAEASYMVIAPLPPYDAVRQHLERARRAVLEARRSASLSESVPEETP